MGRKDTRRRVRGRGAGVSGPSTAQRAGTLPGHVAGSHYHHTPRAGARACPHGPGRLRIRSQGGRLTYQLLFGGQRLCGGLDAHCILAEAPSRRVSASKPAGPHVGGKAASSSLACAWGRAQAHCLPEGGLYTTTDFLLFVGYKIDKIR